MANIDTFAYTNAAPQAGKCNQSKELWLGLKDHVLTYDGAQRNSPVLPFEVGYIAASILSMIRFNSLS
ncbi:DNA/RNA endonuclease G (NUC1) [Cryobacterium sp. MP_M5]|nr:DNA/RNA endonuclease G (NUC1) [Cryobacterium sp. MP_M3]MEC5178583.1 DNA/RNA endonuclease G (NUC1) [Cryobacterium sp. MP_M5]